MNQMILKKKLFKKFRSSHIKNSKGLKYWRKKKNKNVLFKRKNFRIKLKREKLKNQFKKIYDKQDVMN